METNIEINKPSPKFQDVSIAPMHTAEHLLNATMVKTFGCPRSRNAHIERKKSKCDYILPTCPTDAEIQAIEDKVNEVISQNLPVTVEFMTHEQAKGIVDLSKLPADASETLRIIRILCCKWYIPSMEQPCRECYMEKQKLWTVKGIFYICAACPHPQRLPGKASSKEC